MKLDSKHMTAYEITILLIAGLAAGFLSGMVGVGGGIILVPIMVIFIGFTQHQAQGNTLALFLLPVGILGVYNYWKTGNVDYKTVLIIGSTFILGSYFGSKISLMLDQAIVKKIFGGLMIIIALRMLFGK